MIRKLLFGALAALALAGGMLMTSAIPGISAPVLTMSAVPHVQVDNDLIQVQTCGPWNNWCQPNNNCGPWNNWCKPNNNCGPWNNWCKPNNNCGPWNNWCKPSGGGGSGCVTIGGVQLCIGGGGSNCHWYNGTKYCNNAPPPGKCIKYNGKTYCTNKYKSPCVVVNGVKYCRH